jgi:RNA polymerase sigma factor (sigma-70 family)
LISAHGYLVDRIVLQVHAGMTHLDIEDLRQAGFVGLVEAASRYKPELGVFAHYAYFRVRGAMIDAHKRVAYRNDTLQSLDSLNGWGSSAAAERFNGVVPGSLTPDLGPGPDELAAVREQAHLLAIALGELEPDERRVFLDALGGIPMSVTSRKMRRPIGWTREKLTRARRHLGAIVLMWGLGIDKPDTAPSLPPRRQQQFPLPFPVASRPYLLPASTYLAFPVE